MKELSYRDLTQRLYNLEYLATLPAREERSGAFSSYDRRSRYDDETEQYQDWAANSDGSGYLYKEGESIVVFEKEGPGVIWRVWSALPESGHIRIFIDYQREPVVNIPFRDFFEQFNKDIPPMNFPELVPTLSRGRNRFIPIPFNQHCKVVFDSGWGRYYHFTYTTFPTETILPQFDGVFDREACIALAEADRHLSQRGWQFKKKQDSITEDFNLNLSPGETMQVCEIKEPRAIHRLKVVPHLESTVEQNALREIIFSIKWDNERKPSVWTPLGDFFATAPGINYFRSLPVGMTDGGFYSNWYMPFNQAQIEFKNEGKTAYTLDFQIHHAPLHQNPDQLLRFHAKWHRDTLLELSQKNGRDIDWPFLIVEGEGRFCGMHLHVWNCWKEPDQPAESWWYGAWGKKNIDWWWGEGDEKFFVDGEKFPSTFGTGSEDYIGYAWSAEPPFPTFDSAFACQPHVAFDGNGHTSVNRFHICDNVPFTTSFEGVLEKYKGNRWGGENYCLYDTISYWYQKAGQEDPYNYVPLGERVGYYSIP